LHFDIELEGKSQVEGSRKGGRSPKSREWLFVEATLKIQWS
jgi:hypothetical protein